MPGMDRTGPQGKGPGTGRGMGLCNNPDIEDSDRPRRFFRRTGGGIGGSLRQRLRLRQNRSGRGWSGRAGTEPGD